MEKRNENEEDKGRGKKLEENGRRKKIKEEKRKWKKRLEEKRRWKRGKGYLRGKMMKEDERR